MTPVFCCGFECGRIAASGANVGEHWVSDGANAPTIETTTVRSGSRAMRCTAGASAPGAQSPAGILGSTRHIGRFYIYFVTLPSVTGFIATFGAVATGPNVRFNASDSKIYAAVSTTLGASGVSVITGVWYRIDYDYNVDTAGNDFCDVQVDGSACGQATAGGLSSGWNLDRFGLGGNSGDAIYDDIVLSSTAADYPIGAGYVNHFVPTADGTHNVAGAADFRRGGTTTDILNTTTDAYLLIDEVPLDDATPDTDDHIRIVAPANVTDYVECVFGPAPGIATPTVGPRAVEVIAEVFAAGTGLSDEIIKLNDNGTVADIYNGTQIAGVTTGTYKRAHFADPPSAASVWNANGDGSDGDFRDLRVRYGFATDANPDKSLMCVMIEAEFAPDVPATGYWTSHRLPMLGVG